MTRRKVLSYLSPPFFWFREDFVAVCSFVPCRLLLQKWRERPRIFVVFPGGFSSEKLNGEERERVDGGEERSGSVGSNYGFGRSWVRKGV